MMARMMPVTSPQDNVSPKKIQASTAIWNNIVLLIMLDSMADNVRKLRFQRVNATALLTTANQMMIPQLFRDKLGIPSMRIPPARSRKPPMPMLVIVTARGDNLPLRLTSLPMIAEMELASMPTPATIKPIIWFFGREIGYRKAITPIR